MKMKQYIIGAIIGAVVIATAFLGYNFYKEIQTVHNLQIFSGQVQTWICKQDPTACGQKAAPETVPTK